MKTGASSLNPYAASYVPLFKRGLADVSQAQELNSGNEPVRFANQPESTLPQGQYQNVSQSYFHGAGAVPTAEFAKRKDHYGGDFFASTSRNPNEMPEKSNFDEEYDMDLAYLQMTFPGISEESLTDVYLANKCDLDAAVDMLNQLEIYPDDSSPKLPDTLDIGDVPESMPASELASQKVKNAKPEATASTSAPSNLSSPS